MERTLVLVKPDGVQRGLIGEIIGRLEKKGLKIVGIKMVHLNESSASTHYAHMKEKTYFNDIVNYMTSSPVVALAIEGLDCVSTVRNLCGLTKAREANPGSIRGDLAMSIQINTVHASDSLASAESEIIQFFNKSELLHYDMILYPWIYCPEELQIKSN